MIKQSNIPGFEVSKCNLLVWSTQAQKAEKDATELKGTMRKRMEFLDLD